MKKKSLFFYCFKFYLENSYVHLTNVAIQKKGTDYNEKQGNKFHIKNLRM